MALKIYFCDGCNESIPLKDINENRITIDAGKIFCAKCAPKNPTRDPSRTSPVFVATLVALVGIGFGIIALITSQQIRDINTDIRDGKTKIDGLKSDFAALKSEMMPREDAERTRTTVLDSIAAMQKELAGQSDRLRVHEAFVRTEVESLEKRMGDAVRAELTALARQLNQLAEEWRAGAAGSEALKGSVATVEASIVQLRSDLEAVKSARGSGGGGAGAESGPTDGGLPDDSSRDLLSSLKDADPMRRFSAVMELARFRTPAVVTALEGMLQDPESYVRDGSVRALRKINAPSSIPAVIKALRDDDFFVRSSARDALKTMTTMDIPFDPGADASERESKVREWEGWWTLNHERLLRGK